jgi:hypothetical protein
MATKTPKAKTPKATTPKATPPPAAAPVASPPAAQLSSAKVGSILDDMQQTLARHGVTQPVQVRLADTDEGPCWEYRLVTDDDGNPVYRMVEVPCK